ncbi:MAG: hypothetical protein IPL59_23795 [Candidatus Competibacteraceae bacterium]|nr:hypothetical protein [Candidatus Competibacteraceae bacterium]
MAEIGQMHFEGNIIPHPWYQWITLESGKPDLSAIILLAEKSTGIGPIKPRQARQALTAKALRRRHVPMHCRLLRDEVRIDEGSGPEGAQATGRRRLYP